MRRRWIDFAGTLLVLAVVLFVRRPDSILRPQFFAEDGVVFFLGPYEVGPAAIFRVYSGYLHLLPRLLAQILSGADAALLPLWYNLGALTVWLLVGALCFTPRLKLPFKAGLVLALAFVPHTGEVFFSLTNIQWIGAVALTVWLIAEDPETRIGVILTCAGVAICGLTGPFALFMAPWFLLRVFRRRTQASAWIGGTALLAGLVQGLFIATSPSLIGKGPKGFKLIDLAEVFSFRLFGTFWLGYGAHDLPPALWLSLGAAAAVVTGVLVFSAEIPSQSKILIGCAVSFVLPVVIKFAHEPEVLQGTANGDRYFFLPHLILAWILIGLAAAKRPWIRIAACVLLAGAFIGNLTSLRVPPLKDLHWAEHAQSIRDGGALKIPINPGFEIRSPGKNWYRNPPSGK